jgi:hypothetical protein
MAQTFAEGDDIPAVAAGVADHHAEQRRFPRAGAAEDDQRFAAKDVERMASRMVRPS